MSKLELGFSPCPNDTYIFHAITHQLVSENSLEFSVVMDDVEALNKMAISQKPAISKISIGAYPHIAKDYLIMNTGAALGIGVGPVLIKHPATDEQAALSGTVAIPGIHTTANLLLSLFYPDITQKTEMLFSDIEHAVAEGKASAGLLIHEGRFTYQDHGLGLIADLGMLWLEQFQMPLPLGVIVVRRDLPLAVQQKVEELIGKSIQHARKYPDASKDYIAANAQEMENDAIEQHISLYVNQYSEDLGEKGRAAIIKLLQVGIQNGLMPQIPEQIFLNQHSTIEI